MKTLLYYLARGLVKICRWLNDDWGNSGASRVTVLSLALVLNTGFALIVAGIIGGWHVDDAHYPWRLFGGIFLLLPLSASSLIVLVSGGKAIASLTVEFADGPPPNSRLPNSNSPHTRTAAQGALSEAESTGGEVSLCDDHCVNWTGLPRCPECEKAFSGL